MDWLGLLIPVKLAVFCLIIVLVLRSSGSWWCVHLLRPGSGSCSHSCCLDPETPKLLEGPIPKSRMATFQVYAPGAPGGKTAWFIIIRRSGLALHNIGMELSTRYLSMSLDDHDWCGIIRQLINRVWAQWLRSIMLQEVDTSTRWGMVVISVSPRKTPKLRTTTTTTI